MHARRINLQANVPRPYRLMPSEPIVEQKFQPIRPAAKQVTPALAETRNFYGLASTIDTTASSANKSHREIFDHVELRRINVLSKKTAPTRLCESGKSITSEPARESHHVPTVKEESRPFDAAKNMQAQQQLSQSHTIYREALQERIPPVESLDWQRLKKTGFVSSNSRRFTISCRAMEPSGNLCECDHPCRWASRWIQWTGIDHRHNNIFHQLLQHPIRPETQTQIDKDLRRTQPLNRSFQQEETLKMLRDVLLAYSVYDMGVDYVQGMNLIASVLLYHIKEPEKCFWVFVDLMERREFKEIYLDEFSKLKSYIKFLVKLVKYRINDLYEHFQILGVELEHVAYGWFLSLMCNVVPLEASHLVLDKFVCDGWMGFLPVMVSYLVCLKEELLMIHEATDILARFSSHNEQVEWELIITASDSIVVERDQFQAMLL